MAFKAIITATRGVLLGGFKRHESAPFIQHGNAAAWLAQCVHTNRGAGRECDGAIIEVKVPRKLCADT